MVLISSNRIDSRMVQKYIGSAYDTVKYVADNMDALLNISTGIDDISILCSKWFGGLLVFPDTRPNGDPLTDGDMFLYLINGVTYVFNNDQWQIVGGIRANTEVITVRADHLIGSNTVITLQTPFAMGENAITVYVGATYQYSTAMAKDGAYEETAVNIITFKNVTLNIGEKVVVVSSQGISTISPSIAGITELYKTSGSNEKVITLPNNMTYVIGNGNLEVFKKGILQIIGEDYYESTNTTITFIHTISAPETTILFKKGIVLSNTEQGSNAGDIFTINNDKEFCTKRYELNRGKPAYSMSHLNYGDGLSGHWLYYGDMAKHLATGEDIIDPDADWDDQGNNLLEDGVWVRQRAGYLASSQVTTTSLYNIKATDVQNVLSELNNRIIHLEKGKGKSENKDTYTVAVVGEVKSWVAESNLSGFVLAEGQDKKWLVSKGYSELAALFPNGLPIQKDFSKQTDNICKYYIRF